MPLQDLTPQLRTRLNRMERAVGWFILLATILLAFGFGYYIYTKAIQKGWFAIKANFYTYAKSGSGLTVGDPVQLMGFKAGEITKIKPMDPWWSRTHTNENVYIEFVVLDDNIGYIWTEGSHVNFNSGFLDKRSLDLTKGTAGYGTYLRYDVKPMSLEEIRKSADLKDLHLGEEIYQGTNLAARAWLPLATNLDLIASLVTTNIWVIDKGKTNDALTAMWNKEEHRYEPANKKSNYELEGVEPPALTDRLQAMVAQIQAALPGVLQLTNQLANTLSNANQLTANLNIVALRAQTSVSNLNIITAQIKDPHGSLGEWMIPTNINQRLDATLLGVDRTLTNLNDGTISNLNTNLITLNRTLDNVANITSNLNNQVQANTNILTNISDIVVHSDEFIQGLKKFWLFRHLFAAHKSPAKHDKAAKPVPSSKQSKDLSGINIFTNSFEGIDPGDYTNTVDGWTINGASPVKVVTVTALANTGTNILALHHGTIKRTVITIPGKTYTLTFANHGRPSLSPVSWWKAENDATDSAGTNNGTFENGATTVPGLVGRAFSFNGINQDIRVVDSESLHFASHLTTENWVYISNYLGSHFLGYSMIEKFDAPGYHGDLAFSFGIEVPGGQPYMILSPDGRNGTLVVSAESIPLRQWTHIASTYDGANILIYFNGTLQGSVPFAQAIFKGTGDLGIGANVGGEPFGRDVASTPGLIDEPAVYNTALSMANIQDIYAAGSAGKDFPVGTVPPCFANVIIGKATNVIQGIDDWTYNVFTFKAKGKATVITINPLQDGMLVDSFNLVQLPPGIRPITSR
jgi:hypothetical protein